ncbi:MAG: hypothetical protein GF419_14140 [Ignavibacteriales bacterium]|nr:hypothetical protein [Ignavibacteriales bacterium]
MKTLRIILLVGLAAILGCGDGGDGNGDESKERIIYNLGDVVFNPAGGGNRIMIVSMAFEVLDPEDTVKLREKDVIVKDVILTTVSQKRLNHLFSPGYKDTLKNELLENLLFELEDVSIDRVYFTKYVVQ